MLILIICRSLLNMGVVGSNSRSQSQILVRTCYHTTSHNFDPLYIKLALNVYIDYTSNPTEYRWAQVKKYAQGQSLVKPCCHSRGHIFYPFFIKNSQNVYHHNISAKFEHAWGQVRKQVTRSDVRKRLKSSCDMNSLFQVFSVSIHLSCDSQVSDSGPPGPSCFFFGYRNMKWDVYHQIDIAVQKKKMRQNPRTFF